jgi:hypothetical protein
MRTEPEDGCEVLVKFQGAVKLATFDGQKNAFRFKDSQLVLLSNRQMHWLDLSPV